MIPVYWINLNPFLTSIHTVFDWVCENICGDLTLDARKSNKKWVLSQRKSCFHEFGIVKNVRNTSFELETNDCVEKYQFSYWFVIHKKIDIHFFITNLFFITLLRVSKHSFTFVLIQALVLLQNMVYTHISNVDF